MSSIPAKSDLPAARRRLVELMQRINFGRIEGLHLRRGEPLLDPPPRVVREVKFGGDNGPRLESGRKDFLLKGQVQDFFAQLDALGDGVVAILEIKHGLPFKMEVADPSV